MAKDERQIGRWRWDRVTQNHTVNMPKGCHTGHPIFTRGRNDSSSFLHFALISFAFIPSLSLSPIYTSLSFSLTSSFHFSKLFFFSSLEREHPKPIVFGDWLGSLFLLRLRFSLLFVSAVFKVCFSISTDLISVFFFLNFYKVIDFVPLMRFYLVLDLICENGKVLC